MEYEDGVRICLGPLAKRFKRLPQSCSGITEESPSPMTTDDEQTHYCSSSSSNDLVTDSFSEQSQLVPTTIEESHPPQTAQQQQQIVPSSAQPQSMALTLSAQALSPASLPETLARMQPLLRRTDVSHLYIDPDDRDILPGMRGMHAVSELLWQVVVKPAAARRLYSRALGGFISLHFAIVGPNGSGKRAAVKAVCARVGMQAVFINPMLYRSGDIEYAIAWAWDGNLPAVICFDQFSALMAREDFSAEFRFVVLGRGEMMSTFGGLWLALCVEDPATLEDHGIARLVDRRVAVVDGLSGKEAADLLMDRFIGSSGVSLGSRLDEAQQQRLERAAAGCTPSELKAFAGNVILEAFSRCTLAALGTADGRRPSILGTQATSPSSSTRPAPPPKSAASPRHVPRGVGWVFDTSQYECVAGRGLLISKKPTVDANGGGCVDDNEDIKASEDAEVDVGRPLVCIDWNKDAVPLYETIRDTHAASCLGYAELHLPRFERRYRPVE